MAPGLRQVIGFWAAPWIATGPRSLNGPKKRQVLSSVSGTWVATGPQLLEFHLGRDRSPAPGKVLSPDRFSAGSWSETGHQLLVHLLAQALSSSFTHMQFTFTILMAALQEPTSPNHQDLTDSFPVCSNECALCCNITMCMFLL